MSIIGTVALVIAAFMTLIVVASTSMFTMKKPSGPDAMGLAGPFFAGVLAWAALGVAAGIAGGRGSLVWVTDSTPGAILIALAVMIGMGGAALVGIAFSFETRYALRTPVGLLAGFV